MAGVEGGFANLTDGGGDVDVGEALAHIKGTRIDALEAFGQNNAA